MNKKQKKSSKISRGNIILIGVFTCVFILIGSVALHSFTPVNSDNLVFASPTNIFLKAVKSTQGYHYSTQSTKGGKILPSTEEISPSITVSKGNLVQIHLINEEKNQSGIPSDHNINIDEFNVHSKDLGYFQTESITFLADKAGTFDYYSSIHDGMNGTLTVTE